MKEENRRKRCGIFLVLPFRTVLLLLAKGHEVRNEVIKESEKAPKGISIERCCGLLNHLMMLLQGQWYEGIAEAFHGDETVVAGYLRAMQHTPSLIRMYHVEVDETSQPKLESVRLATRNTSLVRIRLLSEENS